MNQNCACDHFGDQSKCGTEMWEGCPCSEACDIEMEKKGG